MRLAISISPSRVSRLHRAHFAHVHAHGVGGSAEFAVHGGQGRFGFLFRFFDGRRGGRHVVLEQSLGIGRLLVHGHTHVVEHRDHDFHRLGIDQLVGQVVGDFDLRQVAARLAQGDQGLQARAALGQVFLGQDRLVQAEFLHQGAFLRLADLHAKGLDLLDRGRGGGFGFGLAFEVGFDVRQVGIVAHGIIVCAGLGLAAPLGGRLVGSGGAGGLGRAARALLGRFVVSGGRSGFGAGGLLEFFGGFGLVRGLVHGHGMDFLGGWSSGGQGLLGLGRCGFGSRFEAAFAAEPGADLGDFADF